jgi:transglutaminase-like putative cysteine protease
MTVMLRTLGVPARLATGFQSGVYNPLTGEWLMRASDAHAWVEAWLAGRGWTTFDPTPPDPNRASPTTLAGSRYISMPPALSGAAGWSTSIQAARAPSPTGLTKPRAWPASAGSIPSGTPATPGNSAPRAGCVASVLGWPRRFCLALASGCSAALHPRPAPPPALQPRPP